MTSLSCLALIILMEAENQNLSAKLEVARTALSIAEKEHKPVCKTLKKPGLYSWNWDGKQTKQNRKEELDKIKQIIIKYKPKPSGRIYMNHRRLGKRFRTDFKLVCKDDLCFY